jgi:hypothetical protein
VTLTRRPPTLLLACIVSFLTACSGEDQGTPIQPETHDTYLVELGSPHGADGAALFTLPAAGLQALEGVEGQLYSLPLGDQLHVLLLRAAPGALSFRIRLSAEGGEPHVELLQVADPVNHLADLSAYHVTITGE